MKHVFDLRTFACRIFLILCGCVFALSAYAQGIVVTGTVTDSDGNPLIGVTVLDLENTDNGSITDVEGNFSIRTAQGARLKFSYVGYKDVIERVDGEKINVTLTEDSQSLDEVVVVGYGTQKKGSITGSITSVNAEAIEDPLAELIWFENYV